MTRTAPQNPPRPRPSRGAGESALTIPVKLELDRGRVALPATLTILQLASTFGPAALADVKAAIEDVDREVARCFALTTTR